MRYSCTCATTIFKKSVLPWHFTTLRAIYIMFECSPVPPLLLCYARRLKHHLRKSQAFSPVTRLFFGPPLSGITLLPSHGSVAPPPANKPFPDYVNELGTVRATSQLHTSCPAWTRVHRTLRQHWSEYWSVLSSPF